jgi:hypothetical protein
MSLHIAAQHLSNQGRGPDDTLVHMSRNEVKSLNDLAMAHGGHLTINPQTGLPEAGFLSAMLPMIAGAALTGLSGGAINPLTAGLLVGGGSYLMNPKAGLMGGLMAGMGAYGGAGLGEALAQQGMEQSAGQKMLENQVTENTTKMGTNLTPEALAKTGLQPGQYGYGLSGEMAGGDMVAKLTGPQYGAGMSAADLNAGLANQSITERLGTMGQGVKSLGTEGGFSNLYNRLGGGMGVAKTALAAAAPLATQQAAPPAPVADKDMGQRYSYSPGVAKPLPAPDVPTYEDMMTKQGNFGRQQNYYPNQGYTPISNDAAKDLYHFAGGGPVEQMSNDVTTGQNTMYPMANIGTSAFATPYQDPRSTNMIAPTIAPSGGGTVNMMSGEPNMQGTRLAKGGISGAGYNLGGYSDGGRLLRGPGDGVSDSIPAVIGKKQPARLADGEFVVPARIVSEIGNGSTEAGARKLYGMMERVQAARGQTVGKGKVARNTRADKYLPA